jgi:diguanylate cyclase (GGDEF)-like protein
MAELAPFGWVAPDAMTGSAGRLETIRNEGVLVFPSAVLRDDGTLIPTDVSARKVDTDTGPVVVSVIRDVTERVAAQRKLEDLAYRDGLTGLSNRTAFEERLRQGIAEARRHGDILGLGYIDLDQFKPVNDRYGHEAGDAVLIEVGHRLVNCLREHDVVARIGGDEFVFMLQRMASTDEYAEIGDRLLEAIRKPISACGVDCMIEATIGFATFDLETDDARSLVVKADTAMYAGKRSSDHAWHVWQESMGMSPSHAVEPPSGRVEPSPSE